MLGSSSGGVFGVVGRAGAQDGVQDVDASAGQGDDGLVVGLAFAAFAVVVGAADRVALKSAERRLVEVMRPAFSGQLFDG
jgi:hypothetical protein